VEAYDLDRTVDSKLANISTRGFCPNRRQRLDRRVNCLGQDPLRVIVRAIRTIATRGRERWQIQRWNCTTVMGRCRFQRQLASDQEAEIIATGVPRRMTWVSAIVRNLAPGNYTAIVRGVL